MDFRSALNDSLVKAIEKLSKFYFTYGTDEAYPFQGGWSEVYAIDREEACDKFTHRHGSRYPDGKIINCASIYSEDHFMQTEMYTKGNFGKFCLEVII